MKKTLIHQLLWLLSSFIFAVLIPVSSSAENQEEFVRCSLVSSVTKAKKGQAFDLAVRFDIDKGWHTYWKNPGDAGIPTKIKWQVPKDVQIGETKWPVPEKFDEAGIVTYGYTNEVLLLHDVTVSPEFSETKLPIKAQVHWLMCHEICLPGKAEVETEILVSDDESINSEEGKPQISEAQSKLAPFIPETKLMAALRDKEILLIVNPHGGVARFKPVEFFSEWPGTIDHGATQSVKEVGGSYHIQLKTHSEFQWSEESRLEGVLFVTESVSPETRRAYYVSVPIETNIIVGTQSLNSQAKADTEKPRWPLYVGYFGLLVFVIALISKLFKHR